MLVLVRLTCLQCLLKKIESKRLIDLPTDIRSNAVDIIKWMGVEPAIRKASTNEEGMQFVRSDGSEIATLRATGRSDVQAITSEYEIFRGALAQIFLEPILDKVDLVLDETIESYSQNNDKVTVTFTKSQNASSYDLLVGADGYTSKIRGTMLGRKPSEQIRDEGLHVAYFTINRDLLRGSKLAKGYSATGGRIAILRPDPHPSGRVRAMFMNSTLPSDAVTRERLNNASREGDEAYKRLMQEMFTDAGWLSNEMLSGMRESEDFYCSIFAQTRSPKLHDGRVVLLGDAGYALPGFGTSAAIMGAYVLAGEMLRSARSGGDVRVAGGRYEELMLPFMRKQQGGDSPVPMRLLNPQTWWGIAIRDVVLRFAVWSGLVALAMRVSAALGFSEARLGIPEYPWPNGDGEKKV